MPLIDDEGNLFGVVNVIDALAVVLLLAVLVAGVAVVGVLGPDGEPDTRYATIELGEQPDYVVDRVSEGDTVSPEGSSHNLTITDVYVTPALENESTQPQVTVRAEINGERIDRDDGGSTFEYDGEQLRVGTELDLETDEYVSDGEVTDVAREDPTLGVEETPVLLESIVSDRTADEIQEGDTVSLGPHTAATVTTVQLYPVGDDEYRALVGAELVTLEEWTTPTYGGQSVTVGSQLQFTQGSYELDAEVVRQGADEEPGEPATATAQIELEDVEPSVADGLREGMTETIGGETLATIEEVETRPAEIVLETEDGDIHEREHPRNKDVTLTVELQTQQTDTQVRFHGESLQEGDEITLDFDTRVIEGTVVQLS